MDGWFGRCVRVDTFCNASQQLARLFSWHKAKHGSATYDYKGKLTQGQAEKRHLRLLNSKSCSTAKQKKRDLYPLNFLLRTPLVFSRSCQFRLKKNVNYGQSFEGSK